MTKLMIPGYVSPDVEIKPQKSFKYTPGMYDPEQHEI
jgi:hypothetical protein